MCETIYRSFKLETLQQFDFFFLVFCYYISLEGQDFTDNESDGDDDGVFLLGDAGLIGCFGKSCDGHSKCTQ